MSEEQETSSRTSGSLSSSDHEDLGVISTNIEPYIDDPLASDEDEEMEGEGDGLEQEGDEDGLALATLEARFLRTEPVENW